MLYIYIYPKIKCDKKILKNLNKQPRKATYVRDIQPAAEGVGPRVHSASAGPLRDTGQGHPSPSLFFFKKNINRRGASPVSVGPSSL